MNFKQVVIALFVLLCSTVAVSELNAKEGTDKTCSRCHGCYEHRYNGRHYHKLLKRGCNFGYRRDYVAKEENFYQEREGKYNHTCKHDDRDVKGYYRYYRNNDKLYYDRYYNDNYRPEVDGNK